MKSENLATDAQPNIRTPVSEHHASPKDELRVGEELCWSCAACLAVEAGRRVTRQARRRRVRVALVQRIRREIAAGSYLNEEKLERTAERLHQALFAAGEDQPCRKAAG